MSNPLLILVQARMNSSRFPGKIMKEVLGIPLLIHQLNRIARIKTVAKIVVITSDQPSDDIIESTSIKYGYEVFSIIVENRHGGTNVHNVPEDKLEIMKNRFEVKLI